MLINGAGVGVLGCASGVAGLDLIGLVGLWRTHQLQPVPANAALGSHATPDGGYEGVRPWYTLTNEQEVERALFRTAIASMDEHLDEHPDPDLADPNY